MCTCTCVNVCIYVRVCIYVLVRTYVLACVWSGPGPDMCAWEPLLIGAEEREAYSIYIVDTMDF